MKNSHCWQGHGEITHSYFGPSVKSQSLNLLECSLPMFYRNLKYGVLAILILEIYPKIYIYKDILYSITHNRTELETM